VIWCPSNPSLKRNLTITLCSELIRIENITSDLVLTNGNSSLQEAYEIWIRYNGFFVNQRDISPNCASLVISFQIAASSAKTYRPYDRTAGELHFRHTPPTYFRPSITSHFASSNVRKMRSIPDCQGSDKSGGSRDWWRHSNRQPSPITVG
jgi:hypothetical protein